MISQGVTHTGYESGPGTQGAEDDASACGRSAPSPCCVISILRAVTLPVNPNPAECSWIDCHEEWVTIGVGHPPERRPVDAEGETRFCEKHLAEWDREEMAAIQGE